MNARKEFLGEVDRKEVLAAKILTTAKIYEDFGIGRPEMVLVLFPDHTEEEYNDFVSGLDFEYDSGYGVQELFGYIWYKDGTWSERGEYDGSEWWEHKKRPELITRSMEV